MILHLFQLGNSSFVDSFSTDSSSINRSSSSDISLENFKIFGVWCNLSENSIFRVYDLVQNYRRLDFYFEIGQNYIIRFDNNFPIKK